jgi:Ca2+-binding RTX toxin-like protein
MKPRICSLEIEALEDRSVPSATVADGVLTITGSDASESVTVTRVLQSFSFVIRVRETVGSTTTTDFPADGIEHIECHLLGGNDSFTNNTLLACSVTGGSGSDDLSGGSGNDHLFGNDGNDTLRGGSGSDTLNGNDGNDQLFGDTGDDYLFCHAGDDIARGGTGHDLLYGDTGDDDLFGDAGADFLVGGSGNDVLVAGWDSDLDRLFGNSGADNFFQIWEGSEVADADWTEGDRVAR